MHGFLFSFRKPTHYIYIYDTTYLSENIGSLSPTPSQSVYSRGNMIVSQRRTSDMKSSEGNIFTFNLLFRIRGFLTFRMKLGTNLVLSSFVST